MNLGTAHVLHANARALPLADNTVDLICTSPPYFALRSYQDNGTHYAGQIGDEPMPAEFVDSLIEVTRECMRVLKPSGSLWVNLGDKMSGGNDSGTPTKSLIGIPWRYALRCIDDLGLILRAEVIWSKPNGLPESVTDRVRRSHETWFHFTLNPRYYSAVDEIREAHVRGPRPNELRGDPGGGMPGQRNIPGRSDYGQAASKPSEFNPLGKLPGSVWTIATEPLRVPESLGVDHFAAFPTEWPKRIIAGWSPAGVCTACGEGRRPVTTSTYVPARARGGTGAITRNRPMLSNLDDSTALRKPGGMNDKVLDKDTTITGYACACPEPTAPTTPGVVLDCFGGTGTTAMVAKALGRTGISVDMSADYCRLAAWRTNDRNQLGKVLGMEKAPEADDGQLGLFGEGVA